MTYSETLGRNIYEEYINGKTMKDTITSLGLDITPATGRYYAERYAQSIGVDIAKGKKTRARHERAAELNTKYEDPDPRDIENTEDLDELEKYGVISHRANHILAIAGIRTRYQLDHTPFDQLKGIRGMSQKTLDEVVNLRRVY